MAAIEGIHFIAFALFLLLMGVVKFKKIYLTDMISDDTKNHSIIGRRGMMKQLLSSITIFLLTIIFFSACTSYKTGNQHNTTNNTTSENAVSSGGIASSKTANTQKQGLSLDLRVGMDEKVMIPDPAATSGNVKINLMNVPNFEMIAPEYEEWSEESKKEYANYLADLSFAGFDEPVYVSSYAIGDMTEATGTVSHISRQTKKGIQKQEVTGSCLCLFVTAGMDSLDTIKMEGTSSFDCYLVILDYQNGVCVKTETDFFLHSLDTWVDLNVADITGDGVEELFVSHTYDKSFDFSVYKSERSKQTIHEIYSSQKYWNEHGEEIDTENFIGTLLDHYKVRLRFPDIGFDQTISMIADGGYKQSDLHKSLDRWGCPNFVGIWKTNGTLKKKNQEAEGVFLYTLDDITLEKNPSGLMQIVLTRSVCIGHRSEMIGHIHTYLEYDTANDALSRVKAKYVDKKTAEKEWYAKGWGKLTVAGEFNAKAHQAYQEALRNIDQDENQPLISVSDADQIAFYDIDGNGVDELLTKGGYLGLEIYTYESGEIKYLTHEKYGDSIKIYPEESVFVLKSGHMDHYYQEYYRINGKKCKILAEKDWRIHYLNRKGTKTRTTYQYKKKGKNVSKTEYQKYVKSLKNGKCITSKELNWQKVAELQN